MALDPVICVIQMQLVIVDLLDDVACAYLAATDGLISAVGLFRGFLTEEAAMDYVHNNATDEGKAVLAGKDTCVWRTPYPVPSVNCIEEVDEPHFV